LLSVGGQNVVRKANRIATMMTTSKICDRNGSISMPTRASSPLAASSIWPG
jgi:hypothetical protein